MMKTMILCVRLFSNNTENLIVLVKANAGQDEAELGQLFISISFFFPGCFQQEKERGECWAGQSWSSLKVSALTP